MSPQQRTFFGEPIVPGSDFDLKVTVAYGGSHICWEPGCDLWVCDAPDHKCVLHSDEAWAVDARWVWYHEYRG